MDSTECPARCQMQGGSVLADMDGQPSGLKNNESFIIKEEIRQFTLQSGQDLPDQQFATPKRIREAHAKPSRYRRLPNQIDGSSLHRTPALSTAEQVKERGYRVRLAKYQSNCAVARSTLAGDGVPAELSPKNDLELKQADTM